MRGLPWSITREDIIQFFSGYQIIAEAVNISLDERQRPSGDARVSFATREEAMRAKVERNHQYIGNRYIELMDAD